MLRWWACLLDSYFRRRRQMLGRCFRWRHHWMDPPGLWLHIWLTLIEVVHWSGDSGVCWQLLSSSTADVGGVLQMAPSLDGPSGFVASCLTCSGCASTVGQMYSQFPACCFCFRLSSAFLCKVVPHLWKYIGLLGGRGMPARVWRSNRVVQQGVT